MRIITIVSIYILTFFTSVSYGITEGYPIMNHFKPRDYNGGSRIYSIVGNNKGLIFAGDKSGVLVFDGESWRKIECGYSVGSMVKGESNTIYLAGSKGIGLLKADSVNVFRFKSLNNYLSSEDNINKFRHSRVYNFKGHIVFVLDNKIIIDTPERLRVLELTYSFDYSQMVNGELYLYSYEKGLFRLENNEVKIVSNNESILDKPVRGIYSYGGELFLINNTKGIYPVSGDLKKPIVNPISNFVLNSFTYYTKQVSDSLYMINTYYNGMVLFNNKGEILKEYDYLKGLINNTVFDSYLDKSNNLWIGTASGISVSRLNFPFTVYNSPQGIGTGYSSIEYKGDLYFATSLGLYKKRSSDDRGDVFQKIFEGHVWGLKIIGDKLYFGHYSGIYVWNNRNIQMSALIQGGRNIVPVTQSKDEYITNSTTGLYLLKKDRYGYLRNKTRINGLEENVKKLSYDINNNLWAETNSSICKIQLSSDNKQIKKIDHFYRISFGNTLRKIVRINNRLKFVADSGVYNYNYRNQEFYKDSLFNSLYEEKIFPTNIIADRFNRLWVFDEGKLHVYEITKGGLKEKYKDVFSYVNNHYPTGQESVFCINEDLILLGIEDSFICFNINNSRANISSTAILRNIQVKSDKGVIKNIWGDDKEIQIGQKIVVPDKIVYDYNSIKFYFSAGAGNYMDAEYQSFLEGYDNVWTNWSKETIREFTNLPSGKYRFFIRSRNKINEYSYVSVCEFVISTPWYSSTLAKYCYIFLFIAFIFIFYKLVKLRIKRIHQKDFKQQEEILYRKEQERIKDNLIKEKEIVKLRNDKLRGDNLHKSKELANTTMSIIKKNQFLTELKDELEKIKEYSEQNKLVTSDIKRVIRKVNNDLDNQENWSVFEEYFDSVHENFFAKLKKKFPDLTSKDLRLCAYVRMNLSTKEIAPLLNISVRGVEISRYRLRKKLNLERNDSLGDFLVKM